MSDITPPPPDAPAQDTNSRVNRLNAAADQNTSNKQSAEQQAGKNAAETEPEKQISHHDPAVTLASTLAKLDQGSYFTAAISGHDADGRTIITSELGTYLVEVEQKYAEELKKIQQATQFEIRVVTVDKEIRAEIIPPPQGDTAALKSANIPALLTLTDISKKPSQHLPQIAVPNETPLDDIRSQYQATTLYKAERMAREIADKLDNLPLPTTSPNYTVYGTNISDNDKGANLSPRKISPNVFIQEVSSTAILAQSNAAKFAPQVLVEQILGKNINVQVIKAVPKTPIPLPAGLPESVIREINALTPLDDVKPGQKLNINIAAVAIPEASDKPASPVQTTVTPNVTTAAATPQAATEVATARIAGTKPSAPTEPPLTNKETGVSQLSQAPAKEAIISGIIIDTTQDRSNKAGANLNPLLKTNTDTAVAATPYSQKNSSQVFNAANKLDPGRGKNYYLATPTAVLKFESNTPLVPGTIVSFTVETNTPVPSAPPGKNPIAQPGSATVTSPATGSQPAATPAEPSSTQTSPVSTAEQPANVISPPLMDRINQFIPQELDQLPDDWTSISMALGALTTSASANMAAILTSRIPNLQSPAQFTSTMFFFLSAIKASQPARTWLGPDVATKLKQLGAGKVVERINHDFTRIARLGSDSPVGEWRPLLIPFQNGPDISAVPMLTKQIIDEEQSRKQQSDKDADDEEVKIKATRFMLEINFSQFGMMLIDGLLKGNRLDVILKSAKDIPFTIKMKLSRQYADALKNNGFDGELVIIDNSPSEVSVRKLLETMTHNEKFEKKI